MFERGSVVAVLTLLAACSASGPTSEERVDQAGEALSYASGHDDGVCASNPSPHCSHGTPLGPKELALTFDDGPGRNTLALSAYLKSQGVSATFFVTGHCFGSGVTAHAQCQQNASASASAILGALVADGHLVGNHTQDHVDLAAFPAGAAGDASIVKELSDTDALIAPFVAPGHLVFRAPFGSWSARDNGVLQASAMSKYAGPVRWDIGGAMTASYAADWDCWQNTNGFGVQTSKACGDRYLQEISAIGRGIVLMHDADYGDIQNHALASGKGNTLDMVKYILPILRSQGYSFRRVDELPDLALPASPACSYAPAATQTSYANEWWVEFTLTGDVASVDLQVAGGRTIALTKRFGKWVGSAPVRIPTGAIVTLHAESHAGETAASAPFAYLETSTAALHCP